MIGAKRPVVGAVVFATVLLVRAPSEARDLTELTLEELMQLEVTSVSRRPERRAEAAAAIAVIDGSDVRRSGAVAIPEALRLAPGLHVARISSSQWAVASRGFSSLNSAKLLVLMDGRSVYTPLFSGVFWDVQDTLLEDLDRIEVIRGPGASLWGANAMNGVINVTTKSARETHGAYVEAGGGTEERVFGGLRYGGAVGDLHYRVFGKAFERDGGFGADDADDWHMGRIGFRADWDAAEGDEVTFQGDLYGGEVGQVAPSIVIEGLPAPEPPLEADVGGGNVLARWRRRLAEGSELELQTYYDRTHRDDPTFRDDLDTFDTEVQHRFALTRHQELIWGIEYRLMSSDFRGRGPFALRPAESNDQLLSGFVQDQIALADDTVRLTIGTKIEHNDYSGVEVQPTGRAAWDPHAGQTVWAAISRAVRVPTRIERDALAEASPPGSDPALFLLGTRSLDAEELLGFELGYRLQATSALHFDLAGFYNRYDSLVTLELDDPAADETGRTILPIRSRNRMDGDARGGEAVATYRPCPRWLLTGAYSFIELHLEPDADSLDLNRSERFEDATPTNQVQLRSFVDLPRRVTFDVLFRWIDALGSNADTAAGEGVRSYFNVDVRLAWRASDAVELSVVGHNLAEERHREFRGGTEVERGVFAKVSLRR